MYNFSISQNAVALVMILVRWCIPDMSPELRDKIRRETYITNEIIIQHEAHRACIRSGAVDEPDFIRQRVQDRESAERWNRVMRSSLSTSEFDLEVHGSPVSPHAGPRIGPAAL